MMTPVLFTFQIILLTLGFGVGYMFLLRSKSQENNLKVVGEVMGWTLIVATIVLELLNFSYSIAIVNNSSQKIYIPVNNTSTTQQQYSQQQGMPMPPQEGEGQPITQEDEGPGKHY